MRRTALAAAAAAMMAQGGATMAAEQGPVVLELYTSQGCSSCPPADALMQELADREDVIALALHVDYWDYIGWEDAFAQPDFTKRQKGYAVAKGAKMIYTPQLVVGGVDHLEGLKPMKLAELIEKHADAPDPVEISLTREGGDQVQIKLRAVEPLNREIIVQLMRYRGSATVNIERGENAGKTLTYRNIVTDWQVVGVWNGEGETGFTADAPGDEPVVAIAQEQGYGPILAAARLR